MTPLDHPVPLLESRQAAAARLAYAVQRAGSVSVLCGPPGTGVSSVLGLVATTPDVAAGQPVVRSLREWSDDMAEAPLPGIVLADGAHAGDGGMLHRLVDRCRRRRPAASLVLAGHGRLLTLIARDPVLEQAVLLRAVLRPFSLTETRRVLDAALVRPHAGPLDDAVILTIHELAAGIPATVMRLAELAGVIAAGHPSAGLSAGDIEAIHRRLCLRAA